MKSPEGIPEKTALPTLKVSRATAGFIARGHPWVRPDRFTGEVGAFPAGASATLVDERGKPLASALIDPAAEICARVYHRRPDARFDPAAAVERAWQRRQELHADPATDCYRLVHGEADFLPGLRVERYGQAVVVLVLADCAAPHADAVCAALQRLLPTAAIVRRDHRDDLRREAVSSRRWSPAGAGAALDPEAVVIGHELGVAYPLRPYAGLATGIYVDQRATRQWLRPLAAGRRVLNLFAYTGAFSLSLLVAGASAAVDVDLSAPALARAAEAAALNRVADRHVAVQDDCRSFLSGHSEAFDLIVCDPPTAAQGGDGWVLRRDYGELLRLACARLAPAGLLVACCNTIGGKPFPLQRAVHDAALAARTSVDDVPGPRLGADIPQLSGFPEGLPYRLVAVRRKIQ